MMPSYRALIVSLSEAILRSHRIVAASDSDAIQAAEEYRDRYLDLEVWRSTKLIATLRKIEIDA